MYNRVKDNIKLLCDIRRQTGSQVNVYLSFVTDKVNLHRIPEFMELGAFLGADTVFCQSVLSYQCSEVTTGAEVLHDTPENRAVIQELPVRNDIQVVPPMLIPFDEHDGCHCVRCIHPFKLLAVDGAGNLSPCCVIPPHSRFGNLKQEPDAWRRGEAMQAFRQEMLDDRDASEEICVQCWERYSLKD